MFRPFPFIAMCVATPLVLSMSVAHAQNHVPKDYTEAMPGYKQAVSAFNAAGVIVIGREISTEQIHGFITGAPLLIPSEMQKLLWEYDKEAPAGEKITEGIKFTQAVAFLKGNLKKSNAVSNKLNLALQDQAFSETLGRKTSVAEQSLWTARIKSEGLWYAPVKSELMKQAKEDKKERNSLINRAYFDTLGRDVTADERTYWLARSEYYDQIVAANHTWLFSSSGASEYPQVVTRALKSLKLDTSDATLRKWMDTFSAGKGQAFSEMVLVLVKTLK
jgi:hypothetical protein